MWFRRLLAAAVSLILAFGNTSPLLARTPLNPPVFAAAYEFRSDAITARLIGAFWTGGRLFDQAARVSRKIVDQLHARLAGHREDPTPRLVNHAAEVPSLKDIFVSVSPQVRADLIDYWKEKALAVAPRTVLIGRRKIHARFITDNLDMPSKLWASHLRSDSDELIIVTREPLPKRGAVRGVLAESIYHEFMEDREFRRLSRRYPAASADVLRRRAHVIASAATILAFQRPLFYEEQLLRMSDDRLLGLRDEDRRQQHEWIEADLGSKALERIRAYERRLQEDAEKLAANRNQPEVAGKRVAVALQDLQRMKHGLLTETQEDQRLEEIARSLAAAPAVLPHILTSLASASFSDYALQRLARLAAGAMPAQPVEALHMALAVLNDPSLKNPAPGITLTAAHLVQTIEGPLERETLRGLTQRLGEIRSEETQLYLVSAIRAVLSQPNPPVFPPGTANRLSAALTRAPAGGSLAINTVEVLGMLLSSSPDDQLSNSEFGGLITRFLDEASNPNFESLYGFLSGQNRWTLILESALVNRPALFSILVRRLIAHSYTEAQAEAARHIFSNSIQLPGIQMSSADLLAVSGSRDPRQRRLLFDWLVEPAFFKSPAAFEPRILRAFTAWSHDVPAVKYLRAYADGEKAQRSKEVDALFPHRNILRQIKAEGRVPQVLVVTNLADGRGDEIIRLVPIVQGLLDAGCDVLWYTPRSSVYGYFGDGYRALAENPHLSLRRIQEDDPPPSHTRFDALIHYDDTRSDKYQVRQDAHVRFAEFTAQPERYALAILGRYPVGLATFDKAMVYGREIPIQPRLNAYSRMHRLQSELVDAPIRYGTHQIPYPVLQGVESAGAREYWIYSSPSRRTVVLNAFGGENERKGFPNTPEGHKRLQRLIANLVELGWGVILLPNHQPWGSPEVAKTIVSGLAVEVRKHVSIPNSTISHAYLYRKAGYGISVEGGGVHTTYNRGEAMVMIELPGAYPIGEWFPAGADEFQVFVPSEHQAARALQKIYEARQTKPLSENTFWDPAPRPIVQTPRRDAPLVARLRARIEIHTREDSAELRRDAAEYLDAVFEEVGQRELSIYELELFHYILDGDGRNEQIVYQPDAPESGDASQRHDPRIPGIRFGPSDTLLFDGTPYSVLKHEISHRMIYTIVQRRFDDQFDGYENYLDHSVLFREFHARLWEFDRNFEVSWDGLMRSGYRSDHFERIRSLFDPRWSAQKMFYILALLARRELRQLNPNSQEDQALMQRLSEEVDRRLKRFGRRMTLPYTDREKLLNGPGPSYIAPYGASWEGLESPQPLIRTHHSQSRQDTALVDALRRRIHIVAPTAAEAAAVSAQLDQWFDEVSRRELTPYEQDLFEFYANGPGQRVPIEIQTDEERDRAWTPTAKAMHPEPNVLLAWRTGSYERRDPIQRLKRLLALTMDGMLAEGDHSTFWKPWNGTANHQRAFTWIRANLWAADGDIEKAWSWSQHDHVYVNSTLDLFPKDYPLSLVYAATEGLAQEHSEVLSASKYASRKIILLWRAAVEALARRSPKDPRPPHRDLDTQA